MREGLFTADEEAGERGGFVNQYFDSEFTVGVKGDELFNKQKKYFKRMWDVIRLVDLVIITLSKLVNWTLALSQRDFIFTVAFFLPHKTVQAKGKLIGKVFPL